MDDIIICKDTEFFELYEMIPDIDDEEGMSFGYLEKKEREEDSLFRSPKYSKILEFKNIISNMRDYKKAIQLVDEKRKELLSTDIGGFRIYDDDDEFIKYLSVLLQEIRDITIKEYTELKKIEQSNAILNPMKFKNEPKTIIQKSNVKWFTEDSIDFVELFSCLRWTNNIDVTTVKIQYSQYEAFFRYFDAKSLHTREREIKLRDKGLSFIKSLQMSFERFIDRERRRIEKQIKRDDYLTKAYYYKFEHSIRWGGSIHDFVELYYALMELKCVGCEPEHNPYDQFCTFFKIPQHCPEEILADILKKIENGESTFLKRLEDESNDFIISWMKKRVKSHPKDFSKDSSKGYSS